ncbi:hypothetical protein FLA_2201 [Filimonas lacunae]|nr:hypothetical protein FLA_2201 [Filimonas lacunae]
MGIGTKSPEQLLQVAGNVLISNSYSLMFRKADSITGPQFSLSGNGGYLHVTSGGIISRTTNVQDLGSDSFRFRNLWLGTNANIGGSVYLNSSDNNGLIVDNNSLSRVGFMKYPNRAAGIWRVTNQNFEIGRVNVTALPGTPTSYTTDLYISESGNIGIGTKTPSQKLSVNGTILAKKMIVSVKEANWADYVFDASYKLIPLQQLEEYVLFHKHLPEVPSAKEVADKGVDVGENQAMLLKKIEELTLYVIEQQKQLDKQKKDNEERNAVLKQRLKALETMEFSKE